MIKLFIIFILIITVNLQYRLWFSDNGYSEISLYQKRLDELKTRVEEKKQRNEMLYAEVLDLRKGQEAVEERARDELGMIKEGETFFQVIEE